MQVRIIMFLFNFVIHFNFVVSTDIHFVVILCYCRRTTKYHKIDDAQTAILLTRLGFFT